MFRRSGSIKLFDLFGFRIGVDASWFLVLFLMIYLLSRPFRLTLHSSDGVAYLTTVISVLLLFASLIAHELGHALVARRQGIEVKQIDLFLFGGLTQMSRDAATPGEDFKISVAGPLATLAVILVCLALDVAIVGTHRLIHAIVLDSDIQITPVLLSLSWLLPMNVLLLAFNLIPAFPLDGGRIARSIVWRVTGDKHRGTRSPPGWARASRWCWRPVGCGCCCRCAASRACGCWRSPTSSTSRPAARDRPVGARRADRGRAGARTSWTPTRWRSRAHAVAVRPWRSTSCATAGPGSRSSTSPAGWRASPARSARRRRSTPARGG